ncbi:MAG: transposase [Chitinispirillaceae bacterium]|nr:transposase [Chitinispirillaceae bacterium]
MGQIGLFDVENRLSEISEMGDSLEKLDKAINWNRFKPVIDKAFRKKRKSNAGRPPYEYILMFKILVLQSMYNLSDEQTQFQILDRHREYRQAGFH